MDQEAYLHPGNGTGELKIGLTDKGQEIIEIAEKAKEKMPNDKRGIVLGAGNNTQIWRDKGWETLDIDATCNPDHVLDANNLAASFGDNMFDFVYVEYLTMHPVARTPVRTIDKEGVDFDEPAVGHKEVLKQSHAALKPGGVLTIETADFGYIEIREKNEPQLIVPVAEEFVELMKELGFEVVLRVDNLSDFTDLEARRDGVHVIWHARKRSDY